MQWKHSHVVVQAKNEITLKSVAYMRNKSLSKAWIALKMGANTRALRGERIRLVVLHVVKRTMVAAWHAWRAHCEHRAIKQERMRRAANYFLNALLSTAWTAWIQFVRDRNHKAKKKGHVITSYKMKLLAGAWKKWHENHKNAIAELAVLKKTMAFIHNQASIDIILNLFGGTYSRILL